MKNLAEFKTNYILFTLESENNETIYKLDRNVIETVRLSDTYDEFGQKVGGYKAGDYSLDNSSCDIVEDMIKEIGEHFTEAEIQEIRENAFSCDDVKDLEITEKSKKIVKKWLADNENFVEVEAFEYWNGSNWQSIIFDNFLTYDLDVKEVDDAIYSEIYGELYDEDGDSKFKETRRETGLQIYEAEKYSYIISNFADSFAGLEIQKN
jgi:hypothetical protein